MASRKLLGTPLPTSPKANRLYINEEKKGERVPPPQIEMQEKKADAEEKDSVPIKEETDDLETKRRDLTDKFGEIKDAGDEKQITMEEAIHGRLHGLAFVKSVRYYTTSDIQNLKIHVTLENVPPSPIQNSDNPLYKKRLEKLKSRRSQLIANIQKKNRNNIDTKDSIDEKGKVHDKKDSLLQEKDEEKDEKDPKGEKIRRFERDIHWQQKILSPAEIFKYSTGSESRKENEVACAKEVHRILREKYPKLTTSKAAKALITSSGGAMIFTMVNDDAYLDVPDANHRVTSSRSLPPRARAKAIRKLREESSSADKKQQASDTTHHATVQTIDEFHAAWEQRKPQRMYILAALNLPEQSRKTRNWVKTLTSTERVIMEIDYYNNGELWVRPDFTADGNWHPIQSQNGSTWRVKIELKNDDDEDDDGLEDGYSPSGKVRFRQKAAVVDPWIMISPPEMHQRVIGFIQLAKAQDFEFSNLQCRIWMHLPAGWLVTPGCDDSCIRGGNGTELGNWSHVSQAMIVSGTRVHHLGWPLKVDLLCRMDLTTDENNSSRHIMPLMMPSFQIEIISVDFFGCKRVEGYATWNVPKTAGYRKEWIKGWKPLGTRSAQIREFFVGGRVGINQEKLLPDDSKPLNKHHDTSGFTTTASGRICIVSNVAIGGSTEKEQELSNFTGNLRSGMYAAVRKSKAIQRSEDIKRSKASPIRKRFTNAVGKVVRNLLPMKQ